MAIKGIAEDVVSALNFDPFEAINGGGGGEAPADEGGQEKQGLPPRGEGGRFTSEASTVKKAIPSAPKVTALPEERVAPRAPQQPQQQQQPEEVPENSVAEMMRRLQSTPAAFLPQATGASAPGGAPGPAAQSGAPQAPASGWAYDYSQPWKDQKINLPEQLVNAIFHEDRNVAAEGMAVLINTMYNSIMNDVHTRVAEVLYHAPTMTAQTADLKVAQNALKTKFYGSWPELADPVGQNTVHTLAVNISNMYQSMGQNVDPMSDDFIGYVGEQAMKMLGRVKRTPQAPRRQFATNGSTREQGTDNPFMSAIGMA